LHFEIQRDREYPSPQKVTKKQHEHSPGKGGCNKIRTIWTRMTNTDLSDRGRTDASGCPGESFPVVILSYPKYVVSSQRISF